MARISDLFGISQIKVDVINSIMTPLAYRQSYNAWMRPEQDHLVIYVKVGTEEGFNSVVVQMTTQDGKLKIFVDERQVAESDGEVMKYG